MRELFPWPDGVALTAWSRGQLLRLPHLHCQARPDGHPCPLAKCSSGSQGRPVARALHGETLMGLRNRPLRALSKAPFSPALQSHFPQGSFPLHLLIIAVFPPISSNFTTRPSHGVLNHPATATGLQEGKESGPAYGPSWSAVPISPQKVTPKQKAKMTCMAERTGTEDRDKTLHRTETPAQQASSPFRDRNLGLG